jgi:hypothetical protein
MESYSTMFLATSIFISDPNMEKSLHKSVKFIYPIQSYRKSGKTYKLFSAVLF